jgi:pentatricopeptide repeat protein
MPIYERSISTNYIAWTNLACVDCATTWESHHRSALSRCNNPLDFVVPSNASRGSSGRCTASYTLKCIRIDQIIAEIEGGELGQESTAKDDACFIAGIYCSLIASHVKAGNLEQAEGTLRQALQHDVPATSAMHASIMVGSES